MRSYLWIFLLATLVAGVISEEGDGSETVPEADAEPADPVPVEEAAPEEGSPTESDPEGEAAPEEGTDVQEESEAAGTATEAPPAVGEAPVEEEAAAGETEAAPEATSEEAAAPTEGADTNEAAVPEGTAAPAPPETEEETQGEVDSTDETAPEATEAPAEKEAEVEAEAGGSATAEETAPDGATEAPVSNEEVEAPVVVEEAKPVEDPVDGFDLSDALGPANEPPADSGKGRARSAGAASGPDGAAEEPKEAGSGKIAGILSAIVVAVVGAASGYFAYQKKKLCFKPQADPESAHKEDPATQAEPQVLSNLLSSS